MTSASDQLRRKPCDVCTVSSCDGWPDDGLVSANYGDEECRAACSSVIHKFTRSGLSVPGPTEFVLKPLAQPDTKIFSLHRDYHDPECEAVVLNVEQAKVVLNREPDWVDLSKLPPLPKKPAPLRAREIDGGDFSFLIWLFLGVVLVVITWAFGTYLG